MAHLTFETFTSQISVKLAEFMPLDDADRGSVISRFREAFNEDDWPDHDVYMRAMRGVLDALHSTLKRDSKGLTDTDLVRFAYVMAGIMHAVIDTMHHVRLAFDPLRSDTHDCVAEDAIQVELKE